MTARSGWSSFSSARSRPAPGSISPTPWSGPTCCARSCSTGRTWSRYFIRSVEADAAADGRVETTALLERLLAYEGVRPLLKGATPADAAGPVLPMHFRKGEVSLQLFTTIATLGTPQDITLQELRIEASFP